MADFETTLQLREELEVKALLVEDGTGGMGVWPPLCAPKGLVFSRNTQKHYWDLGVHMQGWGLGGVWVRSARQDLEFQAEERKNTFPRSSSSAMLGAESWQCRVAGFTSKLIPRLTPRHTRSA